MVTPLPLLHLLIFLRAHLHSIDHGALVLLYDNHTDGDAHAIALGLQSSGTPLMCINRFTYKKFDELTKTDNLLLITLLSTHEDQMQPFERGHHLPRLDLKFMVIQSPDHIPKHSGKIDESKVLYATPRTNGIHFLAWRQGQNRFSGSHSLVTFTDGASLTASAYWLAFIGKLQHLPDHINILNMATTWNPMQLNIVCLKGRLMVTGLDIGIDRLVADRIGIGSLRYIALGAMGGTVRYQVVRQLDDRLSMVYSTNPMDLRNHMLVSHTNPDRLAVSLRRIVVLAPRQMLKLRRNEWAYGMGKTVCLFVGLSVWFSVSRWSIRWVMQPTARMPVGHLFLDTFGRLLSNSPGPWNGRSASEQWMLFVVAVAAILLGTSCAGSLYERSMVSDEEPAYKSLNDLCHHVTIILPSRYAFPDWLQYCNFFIDHNILKYNPNKAYIIDESMADNVIRLGHHYKLDDSSGNQPASMWSHTHWFLESPVRIMLSRTIEHGFHQALRAAANHTLMLGTPHETALPHVDAAVDVQVGGTLLLAGWALSCLAFVGEVVSRTPVRHIGDAIVARLVKMCRLMNIRRFWR